MRTKPLPNLPYFILIIQLWQIILVNSVYPDEELDKLL